MIKQRIRRIFITKTTENTRNMKALTIVILLLFITTSCDRNMKLVAHTDEVITQYKHSPTDSQSYKDAPTIEMFKELLLDKNKLSSSSSMGDSLGRIDFLNDRQKLLTITLKENGGEYANNGDTTRIKLTYRVGQFLIGL